jgi:Fe-Mn family superoxide dismutase
MRLAIKPDKHIKNYSMKTTLSLLFIALSIGVNAQFTQPALPYAYGDLEPYIDAATMEIHYSKHHSGYVKKLNAAVEGTEFAKMDIAKLITTIDDKTPSGIRNNGGGVWNHTFFWESMAPKAGGEPTGAVGKAILKKWGSLDAFKEAFKKAALGQFGSGWAWLVNINGSLEIISTPNQDNPLMPVCKTKGSPLLTLDIWEHAYYLKYQNKRGDYIDNFWYVVNWPEVEKRYQKSLK